MIFIHSFRVVAEMKTIDSGRISTENRDRRVLQYTTKQSNIQSPLPPFCVLFSSYLLFGFNRIGSFFFFQFFSIFSSFFFIYRSSWSLIKKFKFSCSWLGFYIGIVNSLTPANGVQPSEINGEEEMRLKKWNEINSTSQPEKSNICLDAFNKIPNNCSMF